MRYRVFPAPRVNFLLDGSELPVRPDIGFPTQSILFIGLPEVAAPISLEPMRRHNTPALPAHRQHATRYSRHGAAMICTPIGWSFRNAAAGKTQRTTLLLPCVIRRAAR